MAIESSVRESFALYISKQSLSSALDEKGNKLIYDVVRATPKDIPLLMDWLVIGKEFEWVGGIPNESLQGQIKKWVNSSALGGFFLTIQKTDASGSVRSQKVAFMNVDTFPPGNSSREELKLELGRLIVPADNRLRNYGSTLLRHIAQHLNAFILREKALQGYVIHGRRCDDNEGGKALLSKSNSIRQSPPRGSSFDDQHAWYDFTLTDTKVTFAKALKGWREKRNMTRRELADRASISNTMVSAYEKGTKLPKIETLLSLSRVLAENEYEWVTIITSFFSERGSSLMTINSSIEADLEYNKAHFYIFTNKVGESTRPRFAEKSAEAINAEWKRYYFIDSREKSESIILALQDAGAEPDKLIDYVRIIIAPEILCSLRLAIRDTGNDKQESATISLDENNRTQMSQELASSMKDLVKEITRPLEFHDIFKCFTRIYPSNPSI